jgi:hypothetical protein
VIGMFLLGLAGGALLGAAGTFLGLTRLERRHQLRARASRGATGHDFEDFAF